MTRIEIDHSQIEAQLPHRGRALLLDRAEIIQDESPLVQAIGYRIVTLVDCEGHFPGNPIMRGADRVDMIAQTLGIATQSRLPEGYLAYLVRIDGARFPDEAILGDEVRSEATITRQTRRWVEGKGRAFVGDRLVAEVEKISLIFARKPAGAADGI